jgi:phosphotriesterase-related protein
MNRREFLIGGLGGALQAAQPRASILVHEHVMVDFIGADRIGPGRYSPDEVFRVARPKLEEVNRLGCRRLIECTPNYLGRDPELLARLAGATGVELWTNTGLYGASDHKFVPRFAQTETADQLARRWIREAREPWKPRFIKTGVNRGPLDALDRKLVTAAAITSRETGLPIACHTGDGLAALDELEIVGEARVNPSKLIWVHAQNEKDHAIHEKMARSGAWVEFDGIGPKSAAWHVECVRFMASQGLLAHTLISQDSGWYHVGEPGGGDYRGYTYIYTDFLPQLDPAWSETLMWTNPRAAFGR